MKRHIALTAILLVATIIRFIGIYPGYNQFHPDEQMSYSVAAAMIMENSLNPTGGYIVKYAYPYLVPLINVVLFKSVFIPLEWLGFFSSNIGKIVDGLIQIPIQGEELKRIFQAHIIGYREVNAIFWARTITAMFGVATVFLVYRVGKRIANQRVGLIAAFLLTFDFRQVTNSHIALPDIYNSFFLLLSLYASIQLLYRPTSRRYMYAGIAAGLAFNVKFQFFAFLPFVLAHVMATIKHKNIRSVLLNPNMILGCLFIPLITLLVNPNHGIYFEETIVQVTDVALKYGMGTKKLNLFPIWYLFNVELGPALFFTSIGGIVYGLIKRTRESVLISSVIFSQAFIFFYYSTGGFHVRNMIPMSPLFILFAAMVFEKATRKLSYLSFIPLLILVYVPARNAVISDYHYLKPWNFNQLTDWLNSHPLDEPVASNPTDPPTGAPALTRTDFGHSTSFSIAEHRENGARYAIINTDWAGNEFYNWMIGHPGTLAQKWNKPLDELRSTYHGLALEEMLLYQIFASTKPWQAPEANLIVVEFPKWESMSFQEIYKENGDFSNATLRVNENYVYKITADISTKKPLKLKNRDGYIRARIGTTNCVSARSYDAVYTRSSFYCFAPSGADTLELSKHISDSQNEVYARNLIVEQSKEAVTIIPSTYPYIMNVIQLELLYPNSHANL